MSGTISRGDWSRILVPAVSTILGQYDDYPETYKEVFDVRQTSQAVEELLVMSGVGLLEPVAEGGSIANDRMRQLYSINFTPAKYGKMLSITQEMLDDGKALGVLEKQARELKKAYVGTINKVCFDILNNSTTTTLSDGVSLLSTAHPSSAGSQSNRLAVDADLSEASIEQSIIEMRSITNDRGIRIQVMPKKLVVPRASMFESARILDSDGRKGTSDNDLNVLKSKKVITETVVVDHIDDADSFYFVTNVDDGLIVFQRKPLSIDNEPHFAHDAIQWRALTRFAVGVGDWRSVFGSPGA